MTKSARRKVKFKRSFKISNFKLGALVLGVLISLVIAGKVIGFIAGLGQPFSPDGDESRINWDGKATLNLVVLAEETYVLSFNPSKRTVVVLKTPQTMQVNVPFGFGNWSMGSVYKLGQSGTPPLGAKLLKESVSNTLGVPVDGYFIVPDNLMKDGFEKTLDDWRGNPFIAFSHLRQSKTDLSFLEFWQFIWGIRGVRFDKLQTVDLENSNLTSWGLKADGSRFLSLNQAKIDQFIQKQIEESKMKDEGLAIGIYNTTSHPAMAEKAGRLISNMGGRVTFISNSSTALEKSVVLGTSSYTTSYLSHIFTSSCPRKSLSLTQKLFNWPKPEQLNSCVSNSNLPTSRAEVNIFLGEDYFQEHIGK